MRVGLRLRQLYFTGKIHFLYKIKVRIGLQLKGAIIILSRLKKNVIAAVVRVRFILERGWDLTSVFL